MKNDGLLRSSLALIILGTLLIGPIGSSAKETIQQWDLVNPEGVVLVKPVEIAPRPATLEGKTVVLRWNGKPNGDIFLDKIGELLIEKVKGVKVVRSWESAHDTAVISSTPDRSRDIGAEIAQFKPDIVIASTAD